MNVGRMRRYAHRGEVDWAALPPAEKVAIVEAMGFVPMGASHTYDCPLTIGGPGFICNCVGEPTGWVGPKDAQEMRGETWEQRLAKRRDDR
jgi:hypothetical protein